MEGDRKITLLEPGAATQDSYGQVIAGDPVEHIAWAIRRDRGGSEGLQADTRVGEWNTRFDVRMPGLEDIGHTWSLIDERGREYDIQPLSSAAAVSFSTVFLPVAMVVYSIVFNWQAIA